MEESDAVLSDVEGEEEEAVPVAVDHPNEEGFSSDRYKEVLAELDRERAAREAAEASKSEIQVSFQRLKALAHEAIKKRDEAIREKEEALRGKERLELELGEVNKSKEGIERQLEELVKERDGLRVEIENSRHMLVSGIEKISGKVSGFKSFSATGGLPRSQKYTGLPATAYGVIKRTNEIVEEMIRQVDGAAKARNDVREQMDQRNYEIAIEVSQLEATISGLRDEVAKKDEKIKGLEKEVQEKERKVEEIEREVEEKVWAIEKEGSEMRELVRDYDDKVRSFESRMELQRELLADQLNLVGRIHDRLYDVVKIVDVTNLDSELSESLFFAQQTDSEETIRASLAGMESIYELARIVVEKARDMVEQKSCEIRNLNETIDGLVKEKEHIGSLLRSALSKGITSDPALKAHELFQVAETGLKDVGIDLKFNEVSAVQNNGASMYGEDSEICSLAGALENIVKALQLEIIALRHSLEDLRAESSLLKEHMDAQAKELSDRMHRIEELEEKESVANENIEGLMMDIAAAEEEITRWKLAAEHEAAAGTGVEQEFIAQMSTLKQELKEARQTLLESEKKLKFKEETAAAALAAREAAERSLALADMRAARLRDRVEELSRQLEEFETRDDMRGHSVHRYVCWPWQWLGLDFVGISNPETQQSTNEMELSEPLL